MVDKNGVSNMFGGSNVDISAGDSKGEEPVRKSVEEKPTEAVITPEKITKTETVVPAETPVNSFAKELERQASVSVPESAIAEQRRKKREAKKEAEDAKAELETVKKQLNELKGSNKDKDVTQYLRVLEGKESDDAVDVGTVKQVVSDLYDSVSKQAYENGAKASAEYMQKVNAEREAANAADMMNRRMAKAESDEAEFAKKNPGVAFGKILTLAKKMNLISDGEIVEIAAAPGNMVENTYNRIKDNQSAATQMNVLLQTTGQVAEQQKPPGGGSNDNDGDDVMFATLNKLNNKKRGK